MSVTYTQAQVDEARKILAWANQQQAKLEGQKQFEHDQSVEINNSDLNEKHRGKPLVSY